MTAVFLLCLFECVLNRSHSLINYLPENINIYKPNPIDQRRKTDNYLTAAVSDVAFVETSTSPLPLPLVLPLLFPVTKVGDLSLGVAVAADDSTTDASLVAAAASSLTAAAVFEPSASPLAFFFFDLSFLSFCPFFDLMNGNMYWQPFGRKPPSRSFFDDVGGVFGSVVAGFSLDGLPFFVVVGGGVVGVGSADATAAGEPAAGFDLAATTDGAGIFDATKAGGDFAATSDVAESIVSPDAVPLLDPFLLLSDAVFVVFFDVLTLLDAAGGVGNGVAFGSIGDVGGVGKRLSATSDGPAGVAMGTALTVGDWALNRRVGLADVVIDVAVGSDGDVGLAAGIRAAALAMACEYDGMPPSWMDSLSRSRFAWTAHQMSFSSPARSRSRRISAVLVDGEIIVVSELVIL